MGVSIQDRTDFLNMLDACRTEQQLFSRLTFAVMFHQTDPDAREDLLDDVRGAACNMQLPAVNYKIDQWLNTCKQAWQADPAAFMAAVNADAKQRSLRWRAARRSPACWPMCPCRAWRGWCRSCCRWAKCRCWVPTAAPARASGRHSSLPM